MVSQVELEEYLEEIRQNVCSRCVERPLDGPPCQPLGKMCGVELHLPELIESIHQVQSRGIGPYLDRNRHEVCEKCAFLHSSFCPCPMDYLAVLVVQAVEAVDERRQQRGKAPESPRPSMAVSLEDIRQAYREAMGSWTSCDWPTHTGKTGLNLKGWTAARARLMAQARAMAKKTENCQTAEDWHLAAHWLAQVEQHAQMAERRAADAVKAAEEGRWLDALLQAEWAWSLEFATGRPLRHAPPLAWQRLRDLIEATYLAQEVAALCTM